jgi:hypothetical protein
MLSIALTKGTNFEVVRFVRSIMMSESSMLGFGSTETARSSGVPTVRLLSWWKSCELQDRTLRKLRFTSFLPNALELFRYDMH